MLIEPTDIMFGKPSVLNTKGPKAAAVLRKSYTGISLTLLGSKQISRTTINQVLKLWLLFFGFFYYNYNMMVATLSFKHSTMVES